MMFTDFLETRFPEDISFGSSGGPEYFTNVVVSMNGAEQRNINWLQARSKYNVAHGVKNQAQLEKLLAFFRICKGRAIPFRFKDWSDYKARDVLLGVGDGSTKRFNLIKRYQSGAIEEIRRIYKPVYSTVFISGNYAEDDYEVNYYDGYIEFKKAVEQGMEIRASFEFDVPVRFDTDYLPISLDGNGLYSCNHISLIEVRVGVV